MSADRAGYIAGLRQLADHLEADEVLPLPYEGHPFVGQRLAVYAHTLTEFLAYRGALQDPVQSVDVERPEFKLRLIGRWADLHVEVPLVDTVAFTDVASLTLRPELRVKHPAEPTAADLAAGMVE